MKRFRRQVIFAVIALAAWQGVSALKLWPAYVFPTPAGVFESLAAGISDRSFLIGIAIMLLYIPLHLIRRASDRKQGIDTEMTPAL